MSHPEKTNEQLLEELEELRRRNDALEAAAAEWKRDRELLLESEQNFKAVAENANDGILIAAGEGNHVYANHRAAEITGYSVSELLETTIKDLAHPEDFPQIMNRYKSVVEGEPFPRQHETRVVKKDGEAIPVEVASGRTVWRGQPADIVLIRDITKRKRAEDNVRTSEALFRTAIDSLPFDVFAIGEDGRYVMQNSACQERWGDLIGKRPEDTGVDESTLALWKSNNRKVFSGEAVKGEVSFEVEGAMKHYYNIISPIRKGGQIQGILGVNIDITERKRTEEALKESERKFRDLVDNSLVGIYRTNVEGEIFYVNEALSRMLEYDSPEEMMSESVLASYRNYEDRERLLGILENSGRVDSFEFDLLTKKGKTRNVLLSAVLDQDFIAGMIMDISERKRAEEALQATHEELERQVEKRTAELVKTNENLHQEIQERTQIEEALRASEERFRTIFEQSRDAICVIDGGGHYLMVNEAMCELTGVSREELLKTHYSTFMSVDTYKLMEEYWSRRKRNEPAPRRYEFKLIRPDGYIRIVENVPSIIQLPDKGSLTLAILRDVTERRQMEDALESMRSRLLNLQESERSQLSRVLHDTIGQNISILDFNIATIEEVLDQTSRQQISRLIDNMRGIIRETGDKLRDISSGLHPRLIQELGLIEGISSFIDRFRRTTGLQVEASVLGDHLQVEDSVAVNIYRIIQEAFTNIVKHSKCSLVLFELKIEDDCLVVKIKDDGAGFSLADVSQREIDQRGMGLFIMAERVKAIGGKLQIVSEPNRGTALRVKVELKAWSIGQDQTTR